LGQVVWNLQVNFECTFSFWSQLADIGLEKHSYSWRRYNRQQLDVGWPRGGFVIYESPLKLDTSGFAFVVYLAIYFGFLIGCQLYSWKGVSSQVIDSVNNLLKHLGEVVACVNLLVLNHCSLNSQGWDF
jgi:hypothetical protein